jgi:lysozyme
MTTITPSEAAAIIARLDAIDTETAAVRQLIGIWLKQGVVAVSSGPTKVIGTSPADSMAPPSSSNVVPSLNAAGEDLIKNAEGYSATAYADAAGVWSIGWGHTQGVTETTEPITPQQGEAFFQQDVAQFKAMVAQYITAPLNENQYAALVSICYNCGSAPLRGTMGNKLNAHDYTGASEEFGRWIYAAGRILPGLVNRRGAEKALFLTPV